LAEHVNHKVRVLSGSAEILLGLSKNRGDQQILIERLEREAAELLARKLDPKALAALERQAADLDALVSELDQRVDTARDIGPPLSASSGRLCSLSKRSPVPKAPRKPRLGNLWALEDASQLK
jgi:hypothetical protein